MAATIRTIPVMIAHAATTYKRASAVIAGQATMTIPTTKLITPSAIIQPSRPRTPPTMLATPSTRAKAPSKITSTPTVGPGQTMAITPNSTAMNPRSAIAPQLRVIASSMSITSITILGENAPTRPRVGEGNIIEGMATTWETIEERERRVRGTRTTSAMVRAAEQIPGGDKLTTAFTERPFISREELRNIASDHDEGPVITLYLNFSGQRLVRDHPLFLTVFESLRHAELEARKPYIESLPHPQRLRVPEDLADVRAFLEGFEPEGARAIVVFKQGARLNRVMPLPVRVADSLTIDIDPYIEPLEAIVEEQRRVLTVELTKEKTAVSVYELGYDEPVGAIKAFVPSDSVDASRPGKVQRHRLTHLQWHLKSSAQLTNRLFEEKRFALRAVFGEEGLVKEFEDYLPKSLRERLLTHLRLSADANPNQRRAALGRALAEERKREEEAALDELGFFKGHGRLAAGLELVIDAANLFLMRQLFLDDRVAKAGYVCRNHHFLSLTAGACPFDNQPLLPAENVVDELVEIARLHGVEVMLVMYRQDLLGPYEGVAAVLVTATPVDELRAVSVTS